MLATIGKLAAGIVLGSFVLSNVYCFNAVWVWWHDASPNAQSAKGKSVRSPQYGKQEGRAGEVFLDLVDAHNRSLERQKAGICDSMDALRAWLDKNEVRSYSGDAFDLQVVPTSELPLLISKADSNAPDYVVVAYDSSTQQSLVYDPLEGLHPVNSASLPANGNRSFIGASVSTQGVPLWIPSSVINVGVIPQGATNKVNVLMFNVAQFDCEIKEIKTTCGCIKILNHSPVIHSKAWGLAQLLVQPNRIGVIDQTLTVDIQTADRAIRQKLRVSGNSDDGITVSPQLNNLGLLSENTGILTLPIKMSFPGNTATSYSVATSSPSLKVMPQNHAEGPASVIEFQLDTEKLELDSHGLFSVTALITLSKSEAYTGEFPVLFHGRKQSRIGACPTALFLGPFAKGHEHTSLVSLFGFGQASHCSISTSNDWISATLTPDGTIAVTVVSPALAGNHVGTVEIANGQKRHSLPVTVIVE